MSNGELEARMAALAEQVADRPSGSFETADAFGAAVTADLPRPEDHSSFLETVRDHWDRVRWLHEHVAHGTLTSCPMRVCDHGHASCGALASSRPARVVQR